MHFNAYFSVSYRASLLAAWFFFRDNIIAGYVFLKSMVSMMQESMAFLQTESTIVSAFPLDEYRYILIYVWERAGVFTCVAITE